MDLAPRHRVRLDLPTTREALLRSCLGAGASWLHGGDQREDLVAWPGPRFTSRWDGAAWLSVLDGIPVQGSPWTALESVLPQVEGIWMGAATFELACDEAGVPRKALPQGQLGQSWGGVTEALHWQESGWECFSWQQEPPDIQQWIHRLGCLSPPGGTNPSVAPLALAPAWPEDVHAGAVQRIQERILDGAFYVANLCVPFHGTLGEDSSELAIRTLRQSGAPFGALLDVGDTRLLCLSMERLLSRRGERLWSQPIKGSAPLTGDPAVDRKTGQTLAMDPKERAEHTMILDLVRNDLGRVALAGSVLVSQQMALEPYATVLHLVSTVEAQARAGLGLAELLRAVLPGGSVTGAPKHAVCSHLAETEAAPRGFYCGALGWLSAAGHLDLALPIRTAQIEGTRLTYWAGGGITRRSDPGREWQELHLKTRAILG